MVGLSVILEGYKNHIISKGSMIKPPSPSSSSPSPSPSPSSPSFLSNPFSRRSNNNCFSTSSSGFLDHCFLCKQKLLPGKDIYMYKGDRGFCSVECRCRQIFMDEEEILKTKRSNDQSNCSFAAIKSHHQTTPVTSTTPSAASPSPSSSRSSAKSGTPKTRPNGFVY